MKKIIALVLTVMMVASILVTGVSAARVIDGGYVTTPAVTSKVLDTTVGEGCYIYCGDLNVSGQTVKFDLWFESNGGTYSDGWGLQWLNLHTDKIGVGSTTIATDALTPGAWHAVEFEVGSGETTITVDGKEIGTVAAQLDKFACGIQGAKFDNIVVGDKSQDFEGYDVGYDAIGAGRWYFASDGAGGSSIQVAEITPASTDLVITKNANTYTIPGEKTKALAYAEEDKYPDGQSRDEVLYFYSETDHGIFSSDYVGNCVLSVDLCPLSEDATITKWAADGFVTFDMANSKIGVGGVNIALNTPWNVGEWHHVEVYSIYGDVGSVIFVDGALLADSGSVVAGANAKVGRYWCCGIHNVALDNIGVYAGAGANGVKGDELYFEDFEDGVWNKKHSDGAGFVVDAVVKADETKEFDLGKYYWNWDEDNQYAYINGLNDKAAKWELDVSVGAGTDNDVRSYFGADPVFKAQLTKTVTTKYAKCAANGHFADESPVNGVTGNFTMKIVLKSDTEEFENADLGEMVGWLDGSPLINMKAGTISFVGAPSTLNYTFENDKLYTVEFVVGDDTTTVNVNGEEVGTIAKNMRAIVYGVFYRYLVNEIAFIQDGNAFVDVKAEDYDSKCSYLADADIISEKVDVTTPGAIGVGGTTIEYPLVAGEWYHVVLDGTSGSGTDIYVDGVKAGTVATAIKAQWCGKPGTQVSIDNLAITADGVDYFEDFEDKSFSAADGNGAAVAYEYDFTPPEPQKTIFDYIETSEVGGSAYLVANGYDYEVGQAKDNVGKYFDFTGVNPGAREYVINFDLALIPETDTTGHSYFEIWTNTADRRWVVGTDVTGRTDRGTEDLTAFNWGEATKDNFHNVTYEFRNTMGRIYVDKTLVYEYKAGTPWDNLMIGYVWNASAIIDNLKLYRFTDANSAQPNELDEKTIGLNGEEDVKVINLDADDFCAANGHIQKNTERTTNPTCTETGVDTTYCAICGGVAKTTTVPALGHSWPNMFSFDKADGTITWNCKRGDTSVTATLPGAYEGELYFFTDFADAFTAKGLDGEGQLFGDEDEVVANGILTVLNGMDGNYHQIDLPGRLSGIQNSFTMSFDFRFNGTFDTDGTASYGHTIHLWRDPSSDYRIGYNFETNQFEVRDSSGVIASAPFAFEQGRWYQIQLKLVAEGEEGDDWVAFIVDGDEVFKFGGLFQEDDWWDAAYTLKSDNNYLLYRNFGIACDIDNFAIGDINLELASKRPAGDLTGDGIITSKDVKLLKLALAGKYTLSASEAKFADVDNDGVFTAADLRTIKALIAG